MTCTAHIMRNHNTGQMGQADGQWYRGQKTGLTFQMEYFSSGLLGHPI